MVNKKGLFVVVLALLFGVTSCTKTVRKNLSVLTEDDKADLQTYYVKYQRGEIMRRVLLPVFGTHLKVYVVSTIGNDYCGFARHPDARHETIWMVGGRNRIYTWDKDLLWVTIGFRELNQLESF